MIGYDRHLLSCCFGNWDLVLQCLDFELDQCAPPQRPWLVYFSIFSIPRWLVFTFFPHFFILLVFPNGPIANLLWQCGKISKERELAWSKHQRWHFGRTLFTIEREGEGIVPSRRDRRQISEIALLGDDWGVEWFVSAQYFKSVELILLKIHPNSYGGAIVPNHMKLWSAICASMLPQHQKTHYVVLCKFFHSLFWLWAEMDV